MEYPVKGHGYLATGYMIRTHVSNKIVLIVMYFIFVCHVEKTPINIYSHACMESNKACREARIKQAFTWQGILQLLCLAKKIWLLILFHKIFPVSVLKRISSDRPLV